MSGEGLWDDDDDEKEPIEVEATEVKDVSEGNANKGGDLPAAQSSNSLVRPVENVDEVVGVYEQFEEIKSKLLGKEDVQEISGSNHITKSGWRKIATAFNLSVDTVNVEKTVEDGIVSYMVQARATAPNGKSASGSGMCASNESNHMETVSGTENWDKDDDDVFKVDGKWRRLLPPKAVNEHNIMATAETRAKNRAISDLVGGGQVSAEEMKSKILED